MNKNYVALFERMGLECGNNSAYGKYKGFELNALYNGMAQPSMVFHIGFYATEAQKNDIVTELKQKDKRMRVMTTRYGMAFACDMMNVKKIEAFMDAIDGIIDVISVCGGKDARFCPICGEELSEQAEYETRQIDGSLITIHKACIDSVNADIKESNEAFAAAPNNYLKGFLGALIGGAAGIAVALVLYFAGFISAISAFVSVFLGAFMYRKLGGKPNFAMVAIVALTTLVCMISVEFIVVAIELYSVMPAGMTIAEGVSILMQDTKFKSQFIGELVMQVLFTFVGAGYEVVRLAKSVKRDKGI